MNWAWLQTRIRPNDYGALAAQGALWERAGKKDFARREYENFERKHNEKADPRYGKLADWVSLQLKALQSQPLPEEEKSDAGTLALEASELEAVNRLDDARERLQRALEIDPNNVSLLIAHANFLLRRGRSLTDQGESAKAEEHYREVITDCNQILKRPRNTPDAYYLRALANKELRKSDNSIDDPIDNAIEDDLRKALAGDPADGEIMLDLVEVLSEKPESANEALGWLKQSRISELDFRSLPHVYSQMARAYDLQDKRDDSFNAIELAIKIKGDETEFYRQRAETERQRGTDKVAANLAANRGLMEGYRKVAETKRKMGLQNEAFDACWRGIESLLRDGKKVNLDTQRDAERFTRMISDLIKDLVSKEGSKERSIAKATEFWDTVIASGRWTNGGEIFETEKKRLKQGAVLAHPENY